MSRLLASPYYGERMAVDWLDCARYADTNGYHIDRDREMSAWRDWVIDAFNSNQPFDEFTVDQLAGDLLPNATLKQKIATGFHRNHMFNEEGGIPEEYLDRILRGPRGYDVHRLAWADLELLPLPRPQVRPLHAARLLRSVCLLSQRAGGWRRQVGDGSLGARLLPSSTFRRWRKSVDQCGRRAPTVKIDRSAERVYRTDVLVMQEMPKPRPTHILIRGAYDKHGGGGDGRHAGDAAPLGARLCLAIGWDWLAGWSIRANPLPARVTVNRLWQSLFGVGMVRTTEDFGTQGELPSHPELLDWLATEFIRRDWDVKAHAAAVGHQLDLSTKLADHAGAP